MKKASLLFSIMMITALLLAACGGANNTNNGVNDLGTPGVGDVVPTEDLGGDDLGGDDVLDTPTVEVVVEDTPTVEVLEPTATVALEATATPVAGVGDTGDQTALANSPDRLTSYLDYEVRNRDLEQVGEVAALVIDRPVGMVSGDMDLTDPMTLTSQGQGSGQLAYLVVQADDVDMLGLGENEVLVPFSAFESMTAETMTEDAALVLNVDQEVLVSAPAFNRDEIDFAAGGWDTEYRTYWEGEGLSIPVTGDDVANEGMTDDMATNNLVVIEDGFDDIDVQNTNDDDLGEIEDFIIDPQTGELRYGVLAAGGFLGLGERYIPIPMSSIYWLNEDDDMDDLGEIIIPVPEDSFENAPSWDSLDQFDTTVEGWANDIDAYWNSLVQ